MNKLRANFLTGLLVLAPLAVTAWILKSIAAWMWGVYLILPQEIRFLPPLEGPLLLVFNFVALVGITLLLAILVTGLGWISRQYLGIRLLLAIGRMIQRIPLVGTVYSALDQLLKTFSGNQAQKFSRVVYVEFPRKGAWTLGFVTSSGDHPAVGSGTLSVFVPAVPNPMSGFIIIIPESEARSTDLSVEEALKWVLSLGLSHG